MIYHWINFIVLAVALIYFARKKLTELFTSQREKLKLEIDLTNSKHKQVKEELAAVEKLMASMESTFATMKSDSLNEFQAEAQQLQQDTKDSIERLTRDSELKVVAERDKAVATLEKDLLDLAVSRATESLKKEKRDYSREWLQQLGVESQKDLEGKKNYAS